MIDHLTEVEFAEVLHRYVSPTSPIQSEEHLFGRKHQIDLVQQALYAPGRSVFIYGDRGVGKTSLAQTVAYSHQSASHDPVLLACEPHTTFGGLMISAIASLRGRKNNSGETTQYNLKLGMKGFGIEGGRTKTIDADVPSTGAIDLNELVGNLQKIANERADQSTVIVIDEFDRISSEKERTHFADFIKQIGDQRLPFRFVLCGVADSMQKLLGAHASCYRYLEGIQLKTLTYDARYEIIDNIAKALRCKVVDPPRHRIAAISDGFPHYIHRMCEQLLWQMFRDPHPCATPTPAHYRNAVAQSVLGIEQHLRQTYDQAIMKEANGYEQVIWAVADHSDLIRKTEDIYTSYLNVMDNAEEGNEVLDRATVVSRLNALKGKACGNILTTQRRGWYQFRESIIRGYVRLRAEERGCELAFDYAAGTSKNMELKWRPRTTQRRRFGTRAEDKRRLDPPV